MPFQPSTTIKRVLNDIQKKELVIPAIQREFVWDASQIEMLFDSIMRGYPIGQFLSWKVEPDTSRLFKFYDFMRNFHEWDSPHNEQLDLPTQSVVAVLDGQQRLTALNIGLRGSFADRTPGKWVGKSSSYPVRRLYLNALAELQQDERGREFDFRMLTEKQAVAASRTSDCQLIPVSEVFDIEMMKVHELLINHGLGNDAAAGRRVYELHRAVHTEQSITFYQEESQEIERVLDIFVRVNSQGAVLSHSDLLLSIATAQWETRDARKEINTLIDRLNRIGAGFNFRRDLILKAGLVLAGITDFSFKVQNFNAENMDRLEAEWDGISASLALATDLLYDFGLSSQTLPAASVLIPVAYYVHTRQLSESYRASNVDRGDRSLLKSWVLRSQISGGIWGAGLDTLLRDLRSAIDGASGGGYPVAEIEKRMAARNKSLIMNDEEIDDLLSLAYGHQRTFAALAILFPHVNTRNVHHVDHVYPRALLARPRLKKAGLTDHEIELIQQRTNMLANLELLEGPENIGKSDVDPATWLRSRYSPEHVGTHMELHKLPTLPVDVRDFNDFFEQRSKLLRDHIKDVLGSHINLPAN